MFLRQSLAMQPASCRLSNGQTTIAASCCNVRSREISCSRGRLSHVVTPVHASRDAETFGIPRIQTPGTSFQNRFEGSNALKPSAEAALSA